jgi:hypothetical protein
MTLEKNYFDREDWFGLANPDTGAPYPSGLAYGAQIRIALGSGSSPPPQDVITACSGAMTYEPPSSGGLLPTIRAATALPGAPKATAKHKKKKKKKKRKHR